MKIKAIKVFVGFELNIVERNVNEYLEKLSINSDYIKILCNTTTIDDSIHYLYTIIYDDYG